MPISQIHLDLDLAPFRINRYSRITQISSEPKLNDFPVNIFQVTCRVCKGNKNGKYVNCFSSIYNFESSNVRSCA